MRKKQNKIIASPLTMPCVVAAATILWGRVLYEDYSYWLCLLLFVVNIFIIREINHSNAIIRHNGRIIMAIYMVLTMLFPSVMTSWQVIAVQTCLLLSFHLFLMTYQDHDANGRKYYAYLFLGISAMLWQPVLLLLPFLLVCERRFFISFSSKSILACFFGIITPIWFVVLYLLYHKGIEAVIPELLEGYHNVENTFETLITEDYSFSFPEISISGIFSVGFLAVLLVVAYFQYLHTSYIDKIQVRMYYNFFFSLSLIILIMLLVCSCFGLSEVSTQMLFAIFVLPLSFVLSRTLCSISSRIANILSYVSVIVIVGLMVSRAFMAFIY